MQEDKVKFFYEEIGHLVFLEAEHLCFVETSVPLSVKSFYCALLHKKDTAAIGANLKTSVLRADFFDHNPMEPVPLYYKKQVNRFTWSREN